MISIVKEDKSLSPSPISLNDQSTDECCRRRRVRHSNKGNQTVLAISPLISAVALLNEARLLALERDWGAGTGTGGESSLSFSTTGAAPVLG